MTTTAADGVNVMSLIKEKKEWKSCVVFDNSGRILGSSVTPLEGEIA